MVAAIAKKGGLILVPTVVEKWERVYANETRWNRALIKAVQTQKSYKSMSSWDVVEGFVAEPTGDWPCTPKGSKR